MVPAPPSQPYANAMNLTRKLVGNGYVHRMGYYIALLDTEPVYDYLEVGRADAYGGTVESTYSGWWGYFIGWDYVT